MRTAAGGRNADGVRRRQEATNRRNFARMAVAIRAAFSAAGPAVPAPSHLAARPHRAGFDEWVARVYQPKRVAIPCPYRTTAPRVRTTGNVPRAAGKSFTKLFCQKRAIRSAKVETGCVRSQIGGRQPNTIAMRTN